MSQLWPVWETAIAADLAQLKAKNAWTEVDQSSAVDNILLGTTWVFTCKDSTDPKTGKPCLKFKARLTVRGDQQKAADIDENHRASPTADLDMLRLMIATVVLRLNIYLYGLVESAYRWYQTIAATLKEQG